MQIVTKLMAPTTNICSVTIFMIIQNSGSIVKSEILHHSISMATKSANVLARVEPEIKEKAESIMSQLGLPASVVINALYKQIIVTKSIPFRYHCLRNLPLWIPWTQKNSTP